jgi:hypothetical protein
MNNIILLMKNNKFLVIFFLVFFAFSQSFAISNEIKVIVGREIITEQDIMNRVNMIAFLSHVDKFEILKEKKVMNDMLNTLINEKLIIKQSKKNKIIVEEEEIQKKINELLKKSNITQQSFQNAVKSNNLDLETLKNFIVNEVSLRELVVKKIYPKLNSSKYNKELFVEKLQQKFQKSSGLYKIFQFSKNYDKFIMDFINSQYISECIEIEKIAKKFNLQTIFISNLKIEELSLGLRDVILNKEGNRGIFAYKDESEMNIIGFCQIKYDYVKSLDENKIDLMYKDHLLSREINANYQSLRENNVILMKN